MNALWALNIRVHALTDCHYFYSSIFGSYTFSATERFFLRSDADPSQPSSTSFYEISPDVILCGWLGSKHLLTNLLWKTRHSVCFLNQSRQQKQTWSSPSLYTEKSAYSVCMCCSKRVAEREKDTYRESLQHSRHICHKVSMSKHCSFGVTCHRMKHVIYCDSDQLQVKSEKSKDGGRRDGERCKKAGMKESFCLMWCVVLVIAVTVVCCAGHYHYCGVLCWSLPLL